MPKLIKPLTDTECRKLQFSADNPKDNVKRDGGGLLLEVLPSGRKVWRLKYTAANGKSNRATLSSDYGSPGGGLADARRWRDRIKGGLSEGIDPNQQSKAEALARHAEAISTFEAAADEWREHSAEKWSANYAEKVEGIVRRVLLPWLGKRPVAEITEQELLYCLQRVEKEGLLHTAHDARQYASAIFRRAKLLGTRKADNPADALKGVLKPQQKQNYPHLTDPAAIGAMLRAIDGLNGTPEVGYSMRLLPLVFTRPTELRAASWDEIDLDAALWTIPAERMKMRRPHLVPLSEQVVAILRELEPLTRHGPAGLLFPGRERRKPISEATFNAALRRLGYSKEQQTPHGFRHIASTRLHELGWESRIVEMQLAHADRNSIRATYNKAQYLPQRTQLMQAWADHLDMLKAGRADKVTPIKRGVA